MGELGRIAEEKDWGVIEHPIKVSFFGLDLDRKSLSTCTYEKTRYARNASERVGDRFTYSGITGGVWGPRLSSDCGEPNGQRGPGPNLLEHMRGRDV